MLADSTSTCCKQTASLSLCMAVVLGMRSLEGFVQTLYSISAATQGCCHSELGVQSQLLKAEEQQISTKKIVFLTHLLGKT